MMCAKVQCHYACSEEEHKLPIYPRHSYYRNPNDAEEEYVYRGQLDVNALMLLDAHRW